MSKSKSLRLIFASAVVLAVIGAVSFARSEARSANHPASFSERWDPVDGALRAGVFK